MVLLILLIQTRYYVNMNVIIYETARYTNTCSVFDNTKGSGLSWNNLIVNSAINLTENNKLITNKNTLTWYIVVFFNFFKDILSINGN
jgi:hypothetical protein